jgi:RNA polymerase sigma-70 factor, ECF subfamily
MSSQEQHLSDTDLAMSAQAGSMAAFEELVFRYEGRILRFLRHRAASQEDAEDMAQETFVTACQKIARYNPAYSFTAWLFTLARRQAIAAWRARRNLEQEPAQRPDCDERDPARALGEREFEAGIWNWVKDQLPEKQFTAIWLRAQEDLSIKEIAQVMGLTRIHARVLLHRARQKLMRAWPDRNRAQTAAGLIEQNRKEKWIRSYALPL